jgi:hypothetical protein
MGAVRPFGNLGGDQLASQVCKRDPHPFAHELFQLRSVRGEDVGDRRFKVQVSDSGHWAQSDAWTAPLSALARFRGQHRGQHQLANPARIARSAWLNHAILACVNGPGWAHLGSNQGPPACEAGALPLSYAPGR